MTLMNAWLAWFACKFYGHKRGVRLIAHTVEAELDVLNNLVRFRCPRCGQTHVRKARKAKVKA